MALRSVAAAFVFAALLPVCAAAGLAAVYCGDHLLGDLMPCGKRGLLVGLLGIWGTVLFGFLLGQVDRLATWISPATHDASTLGGI